jgi:hypothetical protein
MHECAFANVSMAGPAVVKLPQRASSKVQGMAPA